MGMVFLKMRKSPTTMTGMQKKNTVEISMSSSAAIMKEPIVIKGALVPTRTNMNTAF